MLSLIRTSVIGVILSGLVLMTGVGKAVAEDRALIIGINLYPDILVKGVRGQRNLKLAVYDAKRMAKFAEDKLKFRPQAIKLLTDKEATRDGILKAFNEWLVDGTGPGDRVLFYFSGHGVALTDTNGDEADKVDENLAPHNIQGELEGGRLVNAIVDDEFEKLLARLSRRNVTVIIDACHSGTMSRGFGELGPVAESNPDHVVKSLTPFGPLELERPPLDQVVKHKTESKALLVKQDDTHGENKGSLVIWSATLAAQLAWERYDRPKGGVFTTAFIEAASRGTASDPVPASEVLAYTDSQSKQFCKTSNPCQKNGLTPLLDVPVPVPVEGLSVMQCELDPDCKKKIEAEREKARGLYLVSPLVPPLSLNNEVNPVIAAEVPETTKVDTPQQIAEAYVDAQPAAAATNAAFAHANDFDLKVELLPRDRLKLGELINVRVTSSADGRLYLFDQTKGGKLVQILPNPHSVKDGKDRCGLKAKLPRTIPGDTECTGMEFFASEAGDSAFIAIVAEADAPLGDVIKASGGLDLVKNPKAFLREVASRLSNPKFYADPKKPNGTYRWAYQRVEYKVEK